MLALSVSAAALLLFSYSSKSLLRLLYALSFAWNDWVYRKFCKPLLMISHFSNILCLYGKEMASVVVGLLMLLSCTLHFMFTHCIRVNIEVYECKK